MLKREKLISTAVLFAACVCGAGGVPQLPLMGGAPVSAHVDVMVDANFVDSVAEGAKTLITTFQSAAQTTILPIVEYVAAELRTLETVVETLIVGHAQILKKSGRTVQALSNRMTLVVVDLKHVALETINMCQKVLKIFRMYEKEEDPDGEKAKEMLEYALNATVENLKFSLGKLTEGRLFFNNASDQLVVTRSDLSSFRGTIEIVTNLAKVNLKEEETKLLGMQTSPACDFFSFAIHFFCPETAKVVDATVSVYRAKVKKVKEVIETVKNVTDSLIDLVEEKSKMIKTDLQMVRMWENKVRHLKANEFESTQAAYREAHTLGIHTLRARLKDLHYTCKQFLIVQDKNEKIAGKMVSLQDESERRLAVREAEKNGEEFIRNSSTYSLESV